MTKAFVSILAMAAIFGGRELAFAQAKTEKGDRPAAARQNADEQGLTAPKADAPPSASEPKMGQPENPDKTRPTK